MFNRQLKVWAGFVLLAILGSMALAAQTPPVVAGDRPQQQRPDWGDRGELAQGPPPPGMGGPGGPMGDREPRDPREMHGRQRGMGPMGGPASRWWLDARTAQRVGLTDDQKKRMDEIFQSSRLKLIDLNAGLQREEAILEPLLGADQPDEAKVLPQLDKVVQARGELEKARARMLLGFRRVLTPEQWKKLQGFGPPVLPAAGPMHREQRP